MVFQISSILSGLGFVQSKPRPDSIISYSPIFKVIYSIVVYVDDIILASNNGHNDPTLKAFLDYTFKLK